MAQCEQKFRFISGFLVCYSTFSLSFLNQLHNKKDLHILICFNWKYTQYYGIFLISGITALFLYILVGSVCALVLISMCLVLLLLRSVQVSWAIPSKCFHCGALTHTFSPLKIIIIYQYLVMKIMNVPKG